MSADRTDLTGMAAMVAITDLRQRRAALQWVTSRFRSDERKAAALEAVFGWLAYLYDVGREEADIEATA